MKNILFFLALFILFTADILPQDTLLVPGEYSSIQNAIDSSIAGDLILVDDGEYFENIFFNGKAVTVASKFITDGDSSHIINTIINGSQPADPTLGSVVFFVYGEDTNSVICGFTITGGMGSIEPGGSYKAGGGIIVLSGAKIINNRIINNTVEYAGNPVGGGGIYASVSPSTQSLILNDNLISGNTLSGNNDAGGGLFIYADGICRINNNIIENNSAESDGPAIGGGIYCSTSNFYSVNISILKNMIKSNSANSLNGIYSEGGGIFFDVAKAELRNNLIIKNSSMFGGGISLYNVVTDGNAVRKIKNPGNLLSKLNRDNKIVPEPLILNSLPQDFVLTNNTFADNNSTVRGGGILATGVMIKLINSIIWGNTSPDESQISGSINVEYSDVEGGFTGTGNISLNPSFYDTVNYYLTAESSPCIDAGNPDSIFNDIEDPLHPGFALWPALGTLRNDMGAYGGNPQTEVNNLFVNGPVFQSFLDRIFSVPAGNRQAIADSFLATISSFPFIEENTIAYFIYTGTANQITVPGDANGWITDAFPMTNISGTNLWYRGQTFESDARLDYKFVLNGSSWILDPRNPKTCTGGYGPNSELSMPDYVYPPEINYYPTIPHGAIFDTTFYSVNLNNSRTIKVYLPPGYDPNSTRTYPVILFHDGLEFISLGFANNIIDYLLSQGKIDPVIAVFVPPVDRDNEYAFTKTQQFSQFIIDELMPYIDSRFKTRLNPDSRAMLGISFGGLISTQICYNFPEDFGLCAPMSPAYWPNNKDVLMTVINGPKKNIKFYIDWGTYELSIAFDGRTLVDVLNNKGYENLLWNQWHEGHSWGNWYAHLDIALEHFFPKTTGVDDKGNSPENYYLSQNYPNPFNPSTTIKWQSPINSRQTIKLYDILGKELATLIDEYRPAGSYELRIDAGKLNLSSGIYFYRLNAGTFIETKKMVLVK